MGKRRLYELAQDHGLTTAELLRRLEQAGIEGKKPLSTLEEEEVEAALAETKSGEASGDSSSTSQGPRLAPVERLLLWRKLRHLRKLHEAQLKELAGLAVELQRLDSPRYQELAAERLSEAAKTDEELIELERQLSPDDLGGECPKCGLHSTRTRYCLRCGEKLTGRRADSMSVPGALVAIIAISAAWLLGGANLGGESGSRPAAVRTPVTRGARTPARPSYESVVAIATGTTTAVYHSPSDPSPYTKLPSPNLDGAPEAFLVKQIVGKWAYVYLPVRPNGSTGWIRLRHVRLAKHSYRIVIKLDSHRLIVSHGAKTILRTAVGVGRAVTPTPSGLYYITELLKQPDPTGLYGPYAFGLSAHSNVLHEFAGRNGILGLHGTNFPQGIGTDVSHGCLRVSNKVILKLAHTLPIGTPVRITRA